MLTFQSELNFDDKFIVKVSNNTKKYRLKVEITQEQLAVDVDKSYKIRILKKEQSVAPLIHYKKYLQYQE